MAKGIYSNAMLQANRIVLPRNLIEQIKTDLGKCSDGDGDGGDGGGGGDGGDGGGGGGGGGDGRKGKCNHGPDAEDCQRYCWTVLHKGEYKYELCLW